ncbi:MAG: hypothetical protein H0T13_09550 [Actinobacteria bacterium]|nr:hypothetical protein [Actinomycetota bacterium]
MATAAVPYTEAQPQWRSSHTFGIIGLVAALGVIGVWLPRAGEKMAYFDNPTLVAWLAIAVLMTLVGVVAGHGVTGLARGVLIDDRHRLSLSRLQMLLWTVLVLSGWMAAALSNIGRGAATPLDVAVPSELWLAMGISTASLVASPVALAYKQSKRPGQVESLPLQEDSGWADLFRGEEVTDSHHLDLGKVQMLLFTVVVILAYALALGDLFSAKEAFATLPALDDAVVSLLVISHAGYLAKKAVPTGPPPTGD